MVPVRIGGQTVDPEVVSGANLFIVLYLACFLVCAIILSLDKIELLDAVSASAAHLGNVGPGFGNLGSMENYNALSGVSKFVLSVEMIMGRIEIFGFFLLFGSRK